MVVDACASFVTGLWPVACGLLLADASALDHPFSPLSSQVLSGAILQQIFVVEFTVGHQFCTDCHRAEASDTWNAVVQLRQKVGRAWRPCRCAARKGRPPWLNAATVRRFLPGPAQEDLLPPGADDHQAQRTPKHRQDYKHIRCAGAMACRGWLPWLCPLLSALFWRWPNAHRRRRLPDGIDFFYMTKSDAKRMLDFLMAVVPARFKTSEQLISADLRSNTYNYKVCRAGVVEAGLARGGGGDALSAEVIHANLSFLLPTVSVYLFCGNCARVQGGRRVHAKVACTPLWRHFVSGGSLCA